MATTSRALAQGRDVGTREVVLRLRLPIGFASALEFVSYLGGYRPSSEQVAVAILAKALGGGR